MNMAFTDLFGVKDAFMDISMAGKTDPQIMREGLALYGIQCLDGEIGRMQERYLHFLQDEITTPKKHVMPGIREALKMLKSQGIPVGLLTGNIQRGAEIKLSSLGIYSDFIDGAFGSDNEDRDMLLPVAVDKFRKRGYDIHAEECVIVGDTPRDVQCAKIHGGQAIAVATGPYSLEVLMDTEADLVLEDLTDPGTYMQFLNQ